MSALEVHSRLRKVFLLILDVPALDMEPTLKMGDIEAWDSFNHINLMLAIEAEFGIEFDSNEIGGLLSVGQIHDALHRRLDSTGP